MSEEILFTNPEEQDLESLLETHKAHTEEIDHQAVVAQIKKASQVKPAGNKPQGSPAEHPGGHPLPHEPRDQKFAVGNQMLSKKEYDEYCQNQDPDVYNFLLKAQKSPEIIDENGPQAVGGDPRAPDMDELAAAVGHVCPHCLAEVLPEECSSFKDIGTLVYYGKNEAGEPLIWHYGCWMTQVLLWTKGNAEKVVEKFGGTILELLVWRRESGYCWQRLGMRRDN